MNKTSLLLTLSILLPLLSACATPSIQPKLNTSSPVIKQAVAIPAISHKNPPLITDLTKVKAGKSLKLVRLMEGGACKNPQQGAAGLFRLYASPADISRIIQQQGSGVFADFALQIQHFSIRALQQSIRQLDFHAADTAQQPLKQELTQLFSELIAEDISLFTTHTTLTIDVSPQQDAWRIYLEACETAHEH